MQTLVSILNNITKANIIDNDVTFSIKEIQSLKTAVRIIVSIGIIPCVEKGIGLDIVKLCPNAIKIPQENLSCIQVSFLYFLNNKFCII